MAYNPGGLKYPGLKPYKPYEPFKNQDMRNANPKRPMKKHLGSLRQAYGERMTGRGPR